MKKGWVYKKLLDVCDFQGGAQPPKSEWVKNPQNGYVRMLQIRDFTQSREAIPEYVKLTNKVRTCSCDDIMVGRYGASVGKILTGLAGAYNVALMKTLPDKDFLIKPYLRFYLLSNCFQGYLTSLGGRAAQAGFSKDDLANLSIALPPLSEQKEIVEYLDSSFAKIDKLKENASKNLEEAKALFQSALKNALEPKEGWEEKTLGEMVKDVKYGTSKPACADGAYTYLRMNNITSDGHLDLNDTKTISLDDKELEKCIVRKGDILFNRTNSYEHVGKTCVFTEETPMVIAGYIIRIRLKECLNPYYMNYFFNMKDTKAKLRKISVGAVHQSNINAKAVQTVVIPLPSLSEQQSIVSFLDSLNEKVNTLQQNYSRICDECDALKQAILRQVFE
jgi:type I restriction enzyme S subunit